MDKIDVLIIIFSLISISIVIIQFAHADSVFIDDYRPIGRESVVQVKSFGLIHHRYEIIPANVTVTVNNMTYEGETNRYGYIAFPIKLSQHLFKAGTYDVIITVNDKIYEKILHVINKSY